MTEQRIEPSLCGSTWRGYQQCRSGVAQAHRAQLRRHLEQQATRLLQPRHSTAEPRDSACFATARLGAKHVAAEHGTAEHIAAEHVAAEHGAAGSVAS